MAGKKLEFMLPWDSRLDLVRVAICQTDECSFASFETGMFGGWNAPVDELDSVIKALIDIRAEVLKGAYAETD